MRRLGFRSRRLPLLVAALLPLVLVAAACAMRTPRLDPLGVADIPGAVRPGGPTDTARADGTGASAPAACPSGSSVPIAGMPAVSLPCLARPDTTVAVAAAPGRPMVINLWASWCDPCRREAPLLERAHRTAGDTIAFLGVDSRDERQDALSFLTAANVTYPQVFDPKAAFASQLGLIGLPYTMVIDGSGTIVYRHFGELTGEDLGQALAQLDRPR